MIDWTATLRPASFSGLAFHVASGELEAGHRVNTTAVPNARHVNESFGPAARKFSVEAYLAGDDCLARAAALLSAAEGRHRGLLILPDSGGHLVRLTRATRKFDKDKLGYIALTIEATGEPEAASGGLSANALASSLFAALASVPAALSAFAQSSFSLAGQSAIVAEEATLSAADAFADLAGLRAALRLSPASEAAVSSAFDMAQAALSTFPAAPGAFAAALGEAAIALADASDPLSVVQIVAQSGKPAEASSAFVSTGSSVIIAANAGEAVTLSSAVRAVLVGEAMASAVFADRNQAVETRGLAMAVFGDALARIGRGGLDLARTLSACAGIMGELVSATSSDLAPLVTIRTNLPMPALTIAYAVYGDAHRADDLVARVRPPNPAFMPVSFEAPAA